MAYEIRPYEDKDYDVIRPWFEARWPRAPQPEELPRSGFLIFRDSVPMACGFLYVSQSNMSWFEHLATNPLHSVSALLSLSRLCSFVRQANGSRRMLIFLSDKRLVSFLKKQANLRELDHGVLCEFAVNL
jgi:hypothetical protein